jgi:hypothetical protein
VKDTDIGFAQFMIAKRYARKMIQFLRDRQAEKFERKQEEREKDKTPSERSRVDSEP